MVSEFFGAEESRFAIATLVIIGLNVMLQLSIVLAQNFNRGKRVMIRESLFVLTFVKPGVEVYSVVAGQKRAVYSMFDPKTELGKNRHCCFRRRHF